MYHSHPVMGFERPASRTFRAGGAPGAHFPRLSDYPEFQHSRPDEDVEAEQCTWPEMIDQTRIGQFCGRWDFDDAEDDDPAGGDICDEPHDSREEDGI